MCLRDQGLVENEKQACQNKCIPFKGALDNFNIIPTFFSKKIEISISSEAYVCKMTTLQK